MTRARRSAGRRTPSAAERALWDAATSDVRRHDRDDRARHEPEDTEDRIAGTSRRRRGAEPGPASAPASVAAPDLSHGAAPGLDTRTRLRLKRGQVDIEARLDLHGMTRVEAHGALGAFLADAQADGRRAVLVITGKGLGPRGDVGVLRREVPRWLNQAPLRQRVRAFSYAAPRHGGEGALYVLLRRR